ncbi:DNA glycosylase AlkZ-like family protein [Paractinoplanes maris]|uniref:DNA glycosylase AlkZ-like family protein n=1 Tax=Paractinoplanes maris TaxID=1734446 RepID=UPI002020D01D|nr:crosslink repair DNA glycosylase YcaQ family protein [Actinoplanes maris]
MTATLTAAEARSVAIAAQILDEPTRSATTVFDRLGCVQIDSMSAVRRSHELVLLSRGVPLDVVLQVGTAAGEGATFEGMAHALSLVAMDLWPAFGFRRRHISAHGWRGPAVDFAAVEVARARLEADGRVRLRDFGGMKGSGWERDSPYRWALEWLAATGGAVCAERDRWERVYCRPDLVIPPDVRAVELNDDECVARLCRRAIDALGVATTKDVADYFRIHATTARTALAGLGLEQAAVAGWKDPVWLAPTADPTKKIIEDAPNPLSPFDPLVWTRDRLLRIFGKDYRLEAYKPAAKREFGYFALPILLGDAIVGRIALRRRGDVLVMENGEVDAGLPAGVIDRSAEIVARWTGSKSIAYEGRDHD